MEEQGPPQERAWWQRYATGRHAVIGGAALAVIAVVVAVIATRPSDLERLNDDVKSLNQELTRAQEELSTFQAAETEALSWRTTYAGESGDDPTVMGIVDGHLTTAQQNVATARDSLAKAGSPRPEYAEYSAAEHDAVKAARDMARDAASKARIGVEELRAVPEMADDVLSTYVRTLLWFEVDSWWNSEADEYASGVACYYGELVSTVNPDGSVKETIVDDGRGQSWKAFSVQDYEELVRQGIVPAMDDTNPTRGEVGRYLCGESPQAGRYGVLGEPEVTLVKERGALAMSREDEDAMVGNYQYGTWCVPAANGTPEPLPEPAEGEQPPENADWCWHMPPGEDSRYYYHGAYTNGAWLYTRGPRRCYYCDAQSWSGSPLVPSAQMAQATGADVPNVRGAAQDGGPGTGK